MVLKLFTTFTVVERQFPPSYSFTLVFIEFTGLKKKSEI